MNTLLSEKLRVKIFGREYELDPGSLTHLEASQLAAYVDEKMREIAEKSNIVDTQKIAVLAALNIAFEMGQRQAPAGEGLTREQESVLKGLIVEMDEALA